jgi:hypothetical protein
MDANFKKTALEALMESLKAQNTKNKTRLT